MGCRRVGRKPEPRGGERRGFDLGERQGVSVELATVIPLLLGVKYKPIELAVGDALRPYVYAALGPYLGFASDVRTGATSGLESYTETALGSRAGVGLDCGWVGGSHSGSLPVIGLSATSNGVSVPRRTIAVRSSPCRSVCCWGEGRSNSGRHRRTRSQSSQVMAGIGLRVTKPSAKLLHRWATVKRRCDSQTGKARYSGRVACSGQVFLHARFPNCWGVRLQHRSPGHAFER